MSQDNYLFSRTLTCPPCRQLVSKLESELPEWKQLIKYIDLNQPTQEDMELAIKYGIVALPSLVLNGVVVDKRQNPYFNVIKKCIEG